MEKRPDIRQLELQVKAEKDKITAVRAERFPMVTAFWSAGVADGFR